ncbi:MAG: endonuclease [Thermomicrobiales bacterium]
MFDAEQVARSEARYAERTVERAETEAMIAAGAILDANPPEHVRRRLERKGLPPVLTEQVLRGEAPAVPAPPLESAAAPALNTLERIIGTSDLIEARFLAEGARAGRSICRIEIGEPGGLVAGYGTGVMVSPRLLLTNNHVLASAPVAAASQAEFDYEEDEDGRLRPVVRFTLDPDAFFLTDVNLDYTLVAVHPESGDGRSLGDYGWMPLIVQQGKIIKGESVNIIQHPNGEPKQVALRQNQVVDLLQDFLHYKTDTAPGSSGSPVFNDEWELVALHHSGVPGRDANGNILAIGGGLWSVEMGEHRVKWTANEGARISRIVGHAQSQSVEGARQGLLADALGGAERSGITRSALGVGLTATARGRHTEPIPGEAGGAGRDEPAGGFQTEATATWTIPLQVSIRLGSPVQASQGALVADVGAVSATSTRPIRSTVDDGSLAEALAELERGRRRPYYDQTADERDRDAYYRDLPSRRTRARFFAALSELMTRTHVTRPRYVPSQHVYPWVDLQPNGMLRSIYTGDEYDPEEFIREDVRIEQERGTRLRERLGAEAAMPGLHMQEALNFLEALLPYNCEHVVPQSWFGKDEPMRGDLHHLFACESRCNSFRRNTPYFEVPQFDEAVRQGCGMADGNRFEPSHGKGAAARATLYFLLRYPGQVNRTGEEYEENRLGILVEWHQQEPPEEYERHRNAAIFEKQGNRNPLVDFPEWAAEIDFARGLGS